MAMELLHRGEVHDQSKFSPAEANTFAVYTPMLKTVPFGGDEYKRCLQEMRPALLHHYANNRHHPEHFGEAGIRGMNLIDLLEMFIDWYASTRRSPNGNIRRSIEVSQKRFGFGDELAQIFRNSIELVEPLSDNQIPPKE